MHILSLLSLKYGVMLDPGLLHLLSSAYNIILEELSANHLLTLAFNEREYMAGYQYVVFNNVSMKMMITLSDMLMQQRN